MLHNNKDAPRFFLLFFGIVSLSCLMLTTAEHVRLDRSVASKHGPHGPNFLVGRWVERSRGSEWKPEYRNLDSEIRQRRIRVRQLNWENNKNPKLQEAWEQDIMEKPENIRNVLYASSFDMVMDDDDAASSLFQHKQEEVDWAIPSPLTISGVHPLVVHIPETKQEQMRRAENIKTGQHIKDGQSTTNTASKMYLSRVKAIARKMECEWDGPISDHALPEYHLMIHHQHGLNLTKNHAAPPMHPIHKMTGRGGFDHGLIPKRLLDYSGGADRDQPNKKKQVAGRILKKWTKEWRRWARDITSPSASSSKDHQAKTAWQLRLQWARKTQQKWLDHPEVKQIFLQQPHKRVFRRRAKKERMFSPFPDPDDDDFVDLRNPTHEKNFVSISAKAPIHGMFRKPDMWITYRESPMIKYKDDRPAMRLREAMNEKARQRTKDWRAEAAPVADPLQTSQWNVYDANLWGDVPKGIAVHRPSISAGPMCWDYLGFNGSGVAIAVVDSGIEVDHPELRKRYARGLSLDALNPHRFGDPDPVDWRLETHGTQAAGVALATRGNGICGSGVAPGASLGVVRLLGLRSPTDYEEAVALSYKCHLPAGGAGGSGGHPGFISVSSNSWGPADDGSGLHGPGHLTAAAMDSCVHRVGRGGLGTVYVWAGGNGRANGDNINFDGYANRPETIAVGAITDEGRQAYYSESGACLMTMAPSSGGGRNIISSDLTGPDGASRGMCTQNFGGTSAAAPTVAGVVAMMLQARPDLGWRDVQHIVVRSSKPLRTWTHRQRWVRNGAGFWHSHGYGFGLLNATKAIIMAQQWVKVAHPEVVLKTETFTAVETWKTNPDNPQQRYIAKKAKLEQQKEIDRLDSLKNTALDPKALERLAIKEKRRAKRLEGGGFLFKAVYWAGQKIIGSASAVWGGAVNNVVERSELNAKGFRDAWRSVDPFQVRVVKDRQNQPVGVAIPPGMGANFTWSQGWWDLEGNRPPPHHSSKKNQKEDRNAMYAHPYRAPSLNHLEHLGLQLYLNTPAGRGQIRIHLYSPYGTLNVFSTGVSINDRHQSIDGNRWTFWSVRCWGESSAANDDNPTETDPLHGKWRLEIFHMEPGQLNPDRDTELREKGMPRLTTEQTKMLWRDRVKHPERVDAVVRWWRLIARGTQT